MHMPDNRVDIQIRQAAASEIVDLRHAVLRQGLPREAAIFVGDELPTSRHFGAFASGAEESAARRAVGCATLHLSQWESAPAWQLRGMATDPEFRHRGLARAMLALADEQIMADAKLPRLFWCNARVPAVGFYKLLGWKVVSEMFEIPTAGPHVRMVRQL